MIILNLSFDVIHILTSASFFIALKRKSHDFQPL